ncbi:MAG: Fe-S cluster protein [Candidatus Methanogranum gryphiswaldense]|nr:MAG: Fe-S cluster protein [Candidatus Methanogranum sp. U3.2.1]
MGTTYTAENEWSPPGKNCGLCGLSSCEELVLRIREGKTGPEICPFFSSKEKISDVKMIQSYSGVDVVGQHYSFVMQPIPGEISARKIILPFRPDLVEKWSIVKGDIVVGRPAGAGCPVQHVIRVMEADEVTGVIKGHVVGPSFSRGKDVKDVVAYHMLGFEGMAVPITEEPQFGKRYNFLPGFCMMDRSHTGLVNMVIKKPWGLNVRVEDIIIL